MDLGAEDIGLAYQVKIGRGIIGGYLVQYVVETNHDDQLNGKGLKAKGKRQKARTKG